MATNLKELRKEAYRLWGIGSNVVIYDYPKMSHKSRNQEFKFKLDFSDDKSSWPRTYALANSPHEEPLQRVIIPIILIKSFNGFSLEQKAWYDMPFSVYEKIIMLIEESKLEKKSWFKKTIEFVKGKIKWNTAIEIAHYQFIISNYNEDYIVRLIA